MVDMDPIGPRPAEFPDQLVHSAVTQMVLLAPLLVSVLHPGAGGEGRTPEAGIATTGFAPPVVPPSCSPACILLVMRVLWHHMVRSISLHVSALYCNSISTCAVDVGKSYV